MTTVTLNGHTNVSAIVPMAQIKQYLPDGRFAGLRMKGPALKGGKTLPFIPHFVDSRATLLDLRPESNKGCNEYFYAVKNPSAPAAATAGGASAETNNNNNEPTATAEDEENVTNEQETNVYNNIKSPASTTKQQQNQNHFSPTSPPQQQEKKQPAGEVGYEKSEATSHQSIQDINTNDNNDNNNNNTQQQQQKSPSQPKEEKLDINPQELVNHLFAAAKSRFGSNDKNNRRVVSPGPRKQNESPTVAVAVIPAERSRQSPRRSQSPSKTKMDDLIRQGRDLYESATAALVEFGKNRNDDVDNNNSNELDRETTAVYKGNEDNNRNEKSPSPVAANESKNKNNNSNEKPRSMSEEVINAAKNQFQRSQRFLKDRFGKLISEQDQQDGLSEVPVQTKKSPLTTTTNDNKNKNAVVVFPGGQFSRNKSSNDNDNDDQDDEMMARRARTMTGLRGLVRNEEAMAVGFPVDTKIEPHYTRRNEWHASVVARKNQQNQQQAPPSIQTASMNSNSFNADPGSASVRTAKGGSSSNYYNNDNENNNTKKQQQPNLTTRSNNNNNPYGLHRHHQHPDEDSTHHLIQPHWKHDDEREATVASLADNKPQPRSIHHHLRRSENNNTDTVNKLVPPSWKHSEAEADFQSMSDNNNNRKNKNDNNPLSEHRGNSLTADDLRKVENADENPLARSVPKKQARINSAKNETAEAHQQHVDVEEWINISDEAKFSKNQPAAAAPAASISSSSETSLDTEEFEEKRRKEDPKSKNDARKSYNIKWVQDRADALRLLLAGLAILIGICIACMDRDAWMTCDIRTVSRALRGVVITGSTPIISDADSLVNIVGTHVYVAAKTGIWESCVTARINKTEEGKLLTGFGPNLRSALKTVRDGTSASAAAALLSASTGVWQVTDGTTILTAGGFSDALPVYEICRNDLRDHAECQTFLGLTFVRIATLAVLTLVFSGLFFVAIVLDLAIVKFIKVKIHRVVLSCFLIFIWSVSLSVWVLYVDSANVPAIAGATHAECELEANLREPLAAIAFATIQVASNNSRYNQMVALRDSENRTYFNATENQTLLEMANNFSSVPASALAHRVMYFDDCKIGFSTVGWLVAWMIFTIVIALYILARFTAYSSFNQAQADAHPFNPANLFRFGLQYMLPSVFATGNSETALSDTFGDTTNNLPIDDEEEEEEEFEPEEDEDDHDNDELNRENAENNNNNEDDDGEIVELQPHRTTSSNEPYDNNATGDSTYTSRRRADTLTNNNNSKVYSPNGGTAVTSTPGSPNSVNNNNRRQLTHSNSFGGSNNLNTSSSFGGKGNNTANNNNNSRGGNPGHRKGRGSRGSGEHEDFLSRTLGAVSGVVGAIVDSFTGPNLNNNNNNDSNNNDNTNTNSRKGHRNRGSAGSGNNNSNNLRSPPGDLKRSSSIRQQSSYPANTNNNNSGGGSVVNVPPSASTSHKNVGPPPDHHRRRSSGQSSTGSRQGERSFFQTLTAMAVDKVVPYVIGMPPDVQKREASRLIRQMYPNTPASLINKIVEFVIDSARVLAREAQEEVHKMNSQGDYDNHDHDEGNGDDDHDQNGGSLNSKNNAVG